MAKEKKKLRDYFLAHERGNFRENCGLKPIRHTPAQLARMKPDSEKAVDRPTETRPNIEEVDAYSSAKKLAAKAKPPVDLRDVTGTGKDGKITKTDVQDFIDARGE